MPRAGSELVPRGAVALEGLDDVERLGVLMTKSGFFKDTREAAQAAVKILAGQELGIPPVAAMRGIHVVEGKIELSGTMIGALVKRSPRYDYRVRTHTDKECTIAFLQEGEEIGATTWTLEDAKRAGLATKSNWRQYPRAMLFARAMAEGARAHVPDVFDGPIYSEGEISEATIIDVPAEDAAPGGPTTAGPDSAGDTPGAGKTGTAPTTAPAPGDNDEAPATGDRAIVADDAEADRPTSAPEPLDQPDRQPGEEPTGEAGKDATVVASSVASGPPSPERIAALEKQLGWKTSQTLKLARRVVGKHVVNATWKVLKTDEVAAVVEALEAEAAQGTIG